MDPTYVVRLPQNTPECSFGFVAQNQFWGVFCIKGETGSEDIDELIQSIREQLPHIVIESPEDLSRFMLDQTSSYHHQIIHYAVAAYRSSLYIATHNAGAYLRRQGTLFRIVEGVASTQGSVQAADQVIITTDSLLQSDYPPLQTSEHIPAVLEQYHPDLAAIAVLFDQTEIQQEVPPPPTSPPRPFPTRKILLLVGVMVLIGCIIAGIFATTRYINDKRNEKAAGQITTMQTTYEEVIKKSQTDAKAANDSAAALREQIASLEKQRLSESNSQRLAELKRDILQLQKNQGNLQVTTEKVFFDMKLIDKAAQASMLVADDKNIALYDQALKKIYVIDSTTKAYETYSLGNTTPTLISLTNGTPSIVDLKNGLYIGNDERSFDKKAPRSSSWKKPISMVSYGSNIYLLDPSANAVFKHTPISEGNYSDALSYFPSGSGISIQEGRSMAVDYYIYILSSSLLKFESGSEQSFDEGNVRLSDVSSIVTSENLKYLYGLDTAQGRIIVFDKKGPVLKSYFNPSLKSARMFGVQNDSIVFYLRNNSVYSLDISR